MPVALNTVKNDWFTSKQADKNGDGTIDKMELANYADKAAQKPKDQQSWSEALAGQLFKSADGQGGQSFFDLISKLDGQAGLSQKDLELFAAKDGNKEEIAGADINAVKSEAPQQAPAAAPQQAATNPFQQQASNSYEIKSGDTLSGIALNLKKNNPAYKGQSMNQIMNTLKEANEIKDVNKIYAGKKLSIPA